VNARVGRRVERSVRPTWCDLMSRLNSKRSFGTFETLDAAFLKVERVNIGTSIVETNAGAGLEARPGERAYLDLPQQSL
jgi:hypothetical protein